MKQLKDVFWLIGFTQYSIIPIFQCSINPLFQHSIHMVLDEEYLVI